MVRACIVLLLMGTVMFFAATLLPGCSAPRESADADVAPLYRADRLTRSLATDEPTAASATYQPGHGARPWYTARRDENRGVVSGYQSATTRSAYTYTYDRQTTGSNGRVYDNFNQSTYRTRLTETID